MRFLGVHAPGADPRLAEAVRDAVRRFNASLDIRLRFLSIGMEEVSVQAPDAATAAAAVAAASDPASPGGAADVTLLLGCGEACAAAAAASLRAGVPVVRVGAGRRGVDDAGDRAADGLCGVLLAHTQAEADVLRGEGVAGEVEVVGDPGDPATGERIVRALSRARRRDRC